MNHEDQIEEFENTIKDKFKEVHPVSYDKKVEIKLEPKQLGVEDVKLKEEHVPQVIEHKTKKQSPKKESKKPELW